MELVLGAAVLQGPLLPHVTTRCMNVYSEVSTEDTREALRRLGERLSGAAS